MLLFKYSHPSPLLLLKTHTYTRNPTHATYLARPPPPPAPQSRPPHQQQPPPPWLLGARTPAALAAAAGAAAALFLGCRRRGGRGGSGYVLGAAGCCCSRCSRGRCWPGGCRVARGWTDGMRNRVGMMDGWMHRPTDRPVPRSVLPLVCMHACTYAPTHTTVTHVPCRRSEGCGGSHRGPREEEEGKDEKEGPSRRPPPFSLHNGAEDRAHVD